MAGLLPPVIATLIADTKQYMAKMTEAQATMKEFGDTSKTTGDKLSSYANKSSTAILGLGVTAVAVSVKMATNFQTAMTTLVTGAGEAESNIKMVSAGILQLAGVVGQTPAALAQGMYLIESAGYHGAEGLKVLKAAAEGAAVGGAQMATVANALTTVMHDYNIPATKANQVTSALIQTVASGKTHLEDLAGSLGKVIPTAAAVGVSLAQVSAAMAVQTNAGMSARLAAMHLNATMLAMVAPNKQAAKVLESVGLSAEQLKKMMSDPKEGLGYALQVITDRIGKEFPRGSAAYVAALKIALGGTVGLQTALALTGPHAKEFAADVKTIGDRVNGAGKQVQGFALVQKDLKFQLDSLKGSASALAISFGQWFLPKLSTVASWAAGVFSYFKQHPLIGDIASGAAIATFATALAYKVGKAMKTVFSVGSDIFKGVQTVLGKLGIGNGPNVQLDANTTALNKNTEALLGRPVGGSSLPSSTSGGAGLLSAAAITAAGAALAVYAASHGPNPLGSANVHKQSRFPMPIVTVKNNTTAKIKNR